MNKTARLALCCVLLVSGWVGVASGNTIDSAPPGIVPGPRIVIDMASGIRLLEEVEMCRKIKEENTTQKALIEKDAQIETLLRERIAFLERQNELLLKMNDQVLKNAEAARDGAGGRWYDNAFSAVKWMGLGVSLAVALGGVR